MTSPSTFQPFEVSRRVWSDPTCMLMVFVGASAEFAVHPDVDWLFYTGRLPTDPVARFLSTIDYLRRLIVADHDERMREARNLKQLHRVLEEKRGHQIPALSYRDVLSMDTIYSIRSVPFVTGKDLTESEKDAMVADLGSIGVEMGIPDVPMTYRELCEQRIERIPSMVRSEYTAKLLASYRRALGPVVYELLLSAYPLLVEPEILALLGLGKRPLTFAMRWSLAPACRTGVVRLLYRLLLPRQMKSAVLDWGK